MSENKPHCGKLNRQQGWFCMRVLGHEGSCTGSADYADAWDSSQPSGPVAPEPTKQWSVIYVNCPACGWVHDTEGETQPIYCQGCHQPFYEAVAPAGGQTPRLLHKANEPLPDGCYCKPGKCAAPVIMGQQMPCRDPQKAAGGATREPTIQELADSYKRSSDFYERLLNETARALNVVVDLDAIPKAVKSALALLESERDGLLEELNIVLKWLTESELVAAKAFAKSLRSALAGAPSPQPVHPSEIHAAKLGAKLNAANAALEKMRYDWNCAAKGEDEALRICRALTAENARLKLERSESDACLVRTADRAGKAEAERDGLRKIRARTWKIIDELAQPWQSMTNTQWAMLHSLLNDDVDKIVAGAPSVDPWVRLADRAPLHGVWVWVVWAGKVQCMAAYLANHGDVIGGNGYEAWTWADEDADLCPKDEISHWSPMLKAPTEAAGSS